MDDTDSILCARTDLTRGLNSAVIFTFIFCFFSASERGEEKEVDPRSVAGLVASLYTAAAVCKCMGAARLLLLEGQLAGLSPSFTWASLEMKRQNQV